MATKPQLTRLTYADLCRMFPEDDMRIVELIDGELFVTPPPSLRHQDVVLQLGSKLLRYADSTGGKAYIAPTGVHRLEPRELPGFSISVDELFGPAEDDAS